MTNGEKQFTTVGFNRKRPFKMCFKIYGTGPIKMFFITGYLLSGDAWYNTIARYRKHPDKYTLCTYDQCGTGESGFSYYSTYSELASDANELLAHLKWDKSYIISLSGGTLVAYEFSKLYPNRVESLVLISVPMCGISKYFQRGFRMFHFLKLYSAIYQTDTLSVLGYTLYSPTYLESNSQIEFKRSGKLVKNITILKNNLKSTQQGKSKLLTMSKHCHKIARFKYTLTGNEYSGLNSRPFPIIYFCGTLDQLVSFNKVPEIIGIIQPNKVVICKNAGHCLHIEDPDLVWNEIDKFISVDYSNYNCKIQKQQQVTFEFYKGEKLISFDEVFKPITISNLIRQQSKNITSKYLQPKL